LEDELEEEEADAEEAAAVAAEAVGIASSQCVIDTSSGRRKLLKLPVFEGVPLVSADKAVRLTWSTKARKAGDRIRRVRGEAKAGTEGNTFRTMGEVTAHVTPLVATLDSPLGVTIVVVLPSKFDVQGRGKNLDGVTASELCEPTTTAYVSVMTPSTESQIADTEAAATFEDVLVFANSKLGPTMALAGTLLAPCDPEITITPLGVVQWQFPAFTLGVMLTCGWVDISSQYYRQGAAHEAHKLVLPLVAETSLYFRSGSRQEPLFIVSGTESGEVDMPAGGHAKAATRQMVGAELQVTCNLCGVQWDARRCASTRVHTFYSRTGPSTIRW
jgi:hypothetical protein